MWCKKIKLISLFVVLSAAISCTNSNPFVLKGQVQDPYDNIYNQGNTYIRLEELKSTKGASKTLLDHPQYLKKDMLASVLSSIYFKKKSLTGWQKEQNVFQESELLKLTSHIEDAFTRASPSQYILVNSNYNKGKGLFKSDVYTIFGLFISGDKLNVIFSRIQYEGIIGKGRDKTFKVDSAGTAFVDPFSITKNPFWKINIHSGQRLKKGHDNWLIIDLEKDAFAKKEDHEKKVSPRDKQEGSKTNGTGETISGNPFKGVQPRMSIIKDQLLELKELETTGLINNEDYEIRKAIILGSSKREKNIKDKFNELRKLKEEGFINDIDYEHKKRDLLKKNDEGERGKNIKKILGEYLELRNEGFITDEDYEYKKKKLLKEF
ncbi:MAG: SHOCT domain-containing protein [Candidatus Scalindua sp.]